MTNPLALILALIVLAAAAADWIFNGAGAMLFLARRIEDLAIWMAFWR